MEKKVSTTRASSADRSEFRLRYITLAVGLFALIIRAYYFLTVVPHVPVFGKYLILARHLLDNGLGHGEVWTSSPGYSMILAGFMSLGLDNALLLKGFQLGLGAVTCALAALVAGKLYGPLACASAGIMLGLYSPLLLAEGELLTNSWDHVSLIAAIALILSDKIGSGRRLAIPYLGSAALFGLCASLRPNALPLILLAVLLALWQTRTSSLSRRIGLAAGMAAVAAVIIAPATWHNYKTTGDFIPVTASFGSIFYSSNNYAASGLGYAPPSALSELENALQNRLGPGIPYEHALFTYLAERASGATLSPTRMSEFWFNEGRISLSRFPKRAAWLLASKFYYHFNNYEHLDTVQVILAANLIQDWPSMPFAVIALSGILGLLLVWPKRPAEWFLISAVCLFLISSLLLYVTSRLRMISVPLLAILGSGAMVMLVKLVQQRRFLKLIAIAASSAIFLLLSFSANRTIKIERDIQRPAFTHLMTGIALKSAGQLTAALYELECAQQISPGGSPEAAATIAEIRRSLQPSDSPGYPIQEPDDILTRIDAITQALSQYPADRLLMNRRADLLWQAERRQEAIDQMEQIIEIFPWDPQARFNLARMLAAHDSNSCARQISLCRDALTLGLRLELAASAAWNTISECEARLGNAAAAAAAQTEAQRFQVHLDDLIEQTQRTWNLPRSD